jgi:hypothetical protein
MSATSVVPDAVYRKGLSVRFTGWLLFIAAAVLAFLIYRPDTDAPFEIIDFSETLPFLTDGQSFSDRFSGLVGYYLRHGRAAFALSAGLAAKWSLFGWWTPGWQWSRYFVGLAVVVCAWHLLRALGANRTGASLGAALFIVSEAAAPGWLKPQVNEPFGTLLLLGASLLACQYQRTVNSSRFAIAIALLLGAMIVVKETLIAATFFPIVLALCRSADGLLGWPTRSPRNRTLLFACVVSLAVASMPVLWALTQATPEGYARQFGANDSLLSNAIFGVVPALIPFTPVSQPPGWATTATDLGWLILVMTGLSNGSVADATMRRHHRLLIGLALALPVARLFVYLPWPLQYSYYSLPYLFGIALVSAIGVNRIGWSGAIARAATTMAVGLVIGYAACSAAAHASRQFALRRVSDELVEGLYKVSIGSNVDTIVIGVSRNEQTTWSSFGPTLARFAAATKRPLPPIREEFCPAANSEASGRRSGIVVVALRHHCALTTGIQLGPAQRFFRFNTRSLRLDPDSLAILASMP